MFIDSGLYPISTRPVKPVLRWPGGKRHLVKTLLPLIKPHTRYCEAFGGGLALYLAKDKSAVEIINDVNRNIIALYRCAQLHMPELLRELGSMVCSRDALFDYIAQPGLTDIQRAARFLIVNHTSFGGGCNSFGVSKVRPMWNLERVTILLESIRARLAGTTIENISYERMIKNYDGPDAFWFLDPPYLNSECAAYDGWKEADMAAFAKRVLALQGAWLVTVDDSAFNRDLFAGCQIKAVKSPNRRVNLRTAGGRTFGELIISPAVQAACKTPAKCPEPLSIRGLGGKNARNLQKRALRA